MSKTFALSIGIDLYEDKRIAALRYAESDAKAMSTVLKALCPGEDAVQLLTGKAATRRGIELAVSWLGKASSAEDTVIFYFAGHGSPDILSANLSARSNYLVCWDSVADDLFATAVPMDRVREWFAYRLRARGIVALFDCCFSGAAGGRTFSFGTTRAPYRGDPYEGIAGEGRAILSATGANELALEDEEVQGGVFTCYVLDFLLHTRSGVRPGLASVDELYVYVHDAVMKHSSALGSMMKPGYKAELRSPLYLKVADDSVRRNLRLEKPVFPWRYVENSSPDQDDALTTLMRSAEEFNSKRRNQRIRPDALRALNLRGVDCRAVVFSQMDLSGAELHGADLSGCDAQDANFKGAHLQNTLLRGATLRNACFDDCLIYDSEFTSSDLRGASFRGATMRRVTLRKCRWDSGMLDEADLDETTSVSMTEG
jgi:hypothetical protein